MPSLSFLVYPTRRRVNVLPRLSRLLFAVFAAGVWLAAQAPAWAQAAPAGPAAATPAERHYFETRDRYLKAFARMSPPESGSDPAESRALDDLQQQLRAIVGPVQVAGFAGPGALNLETLIPDNGIDNVDGLLWSTADSGAMLFVATDAVLRNYLIRHPAYPREPARLARNEDWFRNVFHTDAAVWRMVDVPVRAAAGQGYADAFLGTFEQDTGPWAADRLFVFVTRAGRTLAMTAELRDVTAADARCKAVWERSDASNRVALAAYAAAPRQDPARFALIEHASDQATARYSACYARGARAQPWYGAVQLQAQAMVDRL